MNDLISRADAIEAVRKKLQDWGGYAFEDYRRGLYEAQDILEELPSAKPKVVRVEYSPFTVEETSTPSQTSFRGTQEVKIIEIPSADRPQGDWIVTEHCTNAYGFRKWIEIECPFCGERPTYENLDNMNYCPNCGARMYKGGDADEG